MCRFVLVVLHNILRNLPFVGIYLHGSAYGADLVQNNYETITMYIKERRQYFKDLHMAQTECVTTAQISLHYAKMILYLHYSAYSVLNCPRFTKVSSTI